MDEFPALVEAFRAAWHSPPRLELDEWADEFRVLSSEASAEPGRWRTDRVPYLREIMRAISDRNVEQVVIVAASQTGKTEAVVNTLGYYMHQDPAPILCVEPRVEDCKALSKDRIAPMLRDSPALKGRVKDARSRDSGNTVLHKQFPGGHLTMTGANSAAGLSMRPIRVVLLDEVSRYPASAGTEGDPVTLAVKRTTTFWNRKVVMVSSPALEGSCRITAAYEETDQRGFHLACPHCDGRQVLDWSRVEWEKDESVSPRRHFPETAAYHCRFCGEPWNDAQRWAALAGGQWIAKYPERTNRPGFRISQLYSPWKRLGELAQEYLESRGNMEREKAFQNTVLGLPYRISGVTADAERLYERREGYRRGEVPDRALVLVAGTDVHPDRLECEVVGYGRGLESWSIDYHVLQGDPTRPGVWAEFDELVRNAVWERPDGSLARLSRIAVDSGDNTAAVYAWWRRVADSRVMLVKGFARSDPPLSQPRWIEITRDGRKVKRGVQVWSLGVDWFKDELNGFLRLAKPEDGQAAPGYCHFPHYAREHFDQLTAEEKVVERTRNGFQRHVWRKVRPRNERLDARVYARAAAMAHRLDAYRPRDWAKLEERLGLAPGRGVSTAEADLPLAQDFPPLPAADRPEPFRVADPQPQVRRVGGRRSRNVIGPSY